LKHRLEVTTNMSSTPFLDSVSKFKIRNPNATTKFSESEFFKWSSDNFYRTSTGDMS